jgi:hypothetical protein
MGIDVYNHTDVPICAFALSYLWLPTPSLWAGGCIKVEPGQHRKLSTYKAISKIYVVPFTSDAALMTIRFLFGCLNVFRFAMLATGADFFDQSWVLDVLDPAGICDYIVEWILLQVVDQFVNNRAEEAMERLYEYIGERRNMNTPVTLSRVTFHSTFTVVGRRYAEVTLNDNRELVLTKKDWFKRSW